MLKQVIHAKWPPLHAKGVRTILFRYFFISNCQYWNCTHWNHRCIDRFWRAPRGLSVHKALPAKFAFVWQIPARMLDIKCDSLRRQGEALAIWVRFGCPPPKAHPLRNLFFWTQSYQSTIVLQCLVDTLENYIFFRRTLSFYGALPILGHSRPLLPKSIFAHFDRDSKQTQ